MGDLYYTCPLRFHLLPKPVGHNMMITASNSIMWCSTRWSVFRNTIVVIGLCLQNPSSSPEQDKLSTSLWVKLVNIKSILGLHKTRPAQNQTLIPRTFILWNTMRNWRNSFTLSEWMDRQKLTKVWNRPQAPRVLYTLRLKSENGESRAIAQR